MLKVRKLGGRLSILLMVLCILSLQGCGDSSKKTPYLPGNAANPQPAHNALDVDVSVILTWTASERTDSYDIYFGSDSSAVNNASRSSPEFKGNQADLSYDPPGDLSQSTTYYWRIDSVNAFGTTRGDVWFFTTVLGANTICVDNTNGNDSNNGLYWSTAVKTIQRGLNLASDGWTVFVTSGTYIGAGNKSLEFAGKAVRLCGVGGAANCIIDCESDGRAFYFHSGETLNTAVEGITIQNGLVIDTVGGSIRCENSSPTIRNCVIQYCRVEGSGFWLVGGGIYCSDSNAAVINCTIANNSAEGSGGGICCNTSSVTIANCVINRNSANIGGGIYCNYSGSTIINCTIANNSAAQGGGIFCTGGPNTTITNCVINRNSAETGGGICSDGALTITNCTIANNSASSGISSGGGLYSFNSFSTLNNTILWDNTAPSSGKQISGPINLYYCNFADGAGDIVGAVPDPNCIRANPQFVDATAGNYRLQSISPCVDGGDNSLLPAGVTTDLDDNPRIVNGTVDMGAYEKQ